MYQVIGSGKNRGFRVLWMLEELGQPYEVLAVGPRDPRVLEVNPLGKVPVLVDDGQPIPDSLAILHYLADKHGGCTYPAGTLERAQQDAHTGFVLDEMDSLLWTVAKHSFALPEDMRCPDVKEKVRAEYARSLERLEARLGDHEFLMGDRLTVPDIFAVHCLGWGIVAKFPPPSDRLKAYAKGMRARPAYKAAQAA